MNLKDLEMGVQQLAQPDLAEFIEWFNAFRDANVLAQGAPDDTAIVQQEEVLRRRAEYLTNPSLASAWDDGFFDQLRQRLADVRAQKAATR